MTASARRAGIGAIGIVAAEYAVLLLVVTLAAHNENFWHELLETPRSRTGFIAYSAAFAIPAVAFALLARWRPGETSAKAFRIGLLVVAFLATIAAGTLLFAFCQSWDWKMSI